MEGNPQFLQLSPTRWLNLGTVTEVVVRPSGKVQVWFITSEGDSLDADESRALVAYLAKHALVF